MDEHRDVIDEINHLSMLVEKGDFDRETLAFYVASRIVEHGDITFLCLVSHDVAQLVRNIGKSYVDDGEYIFDSMFGENDQTVMAQKLSLILQNIN